MNAIVLTGVTGYLGGQLAAALLRHGQATVYCLIRANGDRAAQRRLDDRIDELGPLDGRARLVAVAADLEAPRLGLADRRWAELAERATAVHHCGAWVHLTAGYRLLGPANVGGTRAMLELAAEAARRAGRTVGFHFVSSLAVFLDARHAGVLIAEETTEPTMDTAGGLGYARSKVAAERELRNAHDRGVAATIYRPGLISAHSTSGHSSSTDTLVLLLRTVVMLRAYPASIGAIPMEAVDEVARHMAVLSTTQTAHGHAYHLMQPQMVPVGDAIAALQRAGHELRPVSNTDWLRLLEERAAHLAITPFVKDGTVGRRLTGTDPGYVTPDFRSGRTWDALRQAGVRPAALDDAYFDRLVAGLAPQFSG